MPRKHVANKAVVIPAVTHPASLVTEFTIAPSTSPSKGLDPLLAILADTILAPAESPVVETFPSTSIIFVQDGDTVRVVAVNDDQLTFGLDVPVITRCALCGGIDCDCKVCPECADATASLCPNDEDCSLCPSCCSCSTCDSCDSKVTGVCETCENCPNCCDCFFCSGCDHSVDSDDYCSTCDRCDSCCECWTCDYYKHDKHPSDDHQCSHCSMCESYCECSYCNHCDETVTGSSFCGQCDRCDNCCSCSDDKCDCGECGDCDDEPRVRRGSQSLPGWEVRGVHPVIGWDSIATNWKSIDPAQSMADFYLLSYMEHDQTRCPSLQSVTDVARNMRTALVAKLDQAFTEYVDIAVGGELRHHHALRGRLDTSDRSAAWCQWPSIRKQVGPQALLDAADLFMELGGSYGGERWAAAARILHARVTNQIASWVFVDRVFTMQHNGGSLLNKVTWGDFTPLAAGNGNTAELCQVIGQAHSAINTDLTLLQMAASGPVTALFRQWWTIRNRALMGVSKSPLIFPNFWPLIDNNIYGQSTYKRTEPGYSLYAALKYNAFNGALQPKPEAEAA